MSDKYSKDLISYEIGLEKDITKLDYKLSVLSKLSKTDEFNIMINLLKRVKNIIKDNKLDSLDVNTDLFESEEEYELMSVINKFENIKNEDFEVQTKEILGNAFVVNNFFDNVMINVENNEKKNNRIAILTRLMKSIDSVVSV